MPRLPLILLILFVPTVLAGGYFGFWFHMGTVAKDELLAWEAQKKREGFRIGHGKLYIDGFPFEVRLNLPSPSVTAPEVVGGWRWSGDKVEVSASPADFSEISAALVGSHDFVLPEAYGRKHLTVSGETAQATVAMGRDGKPQTLDVTLTNGAVTGLFNGGVTQVRSFWLSFAYAGTGLEDTRAGDVSAALKVEARGLSMPPEAARIIGPQLESLDLEAFVKGPVYENLALPLALRKWRFEGGTVEVARLDIVWPPLRMDAAGEMALDDDLQPMGSLNANYQGFFNAVDGLTRKGIIKRGDAITAKAVLGLMSKPLKPGGPPVLIMPMTLDDQQKLYVGPVPLLRLPPIPWDPADPHSTGMPLTPGLDIRPDGTIIDN